VREKDSVKVFVVSDSQKAAKYKLRTSLLDFSGKVIKTVERAVNIPANTSTLTAVLAEQEWLRGVDRSAVVLHLSLVKGRNLISENILYFGKQNALTLLKPEITIQKIDATHFELSTNTLAKNVWLDLPGSMNAFSDNYFDLIPGIKKVVTLNVSAAKAIDAGAIKTRSLVDTY
jgi:beta-mannosidase